MCRYHSIKNSTFFFLCAVAIGLQLTATQAIAQVDGGVSISPPKMELTIPAGGEKTVGIVVDYTRDFAEAKLPIARLVARLEDWTVMPDGEVKFLPSGSLARSAAKWITYNPPEFTLSADTRQIIRFTISVPKDTPPGDYYFACYIESRTPPPPPKHGERQIYIGFRYYSIVYVMVPGLTTDASLKALEAKVVNGFPVVIPQMENKGNSHARPKHAIEIRGADGKIMFSSAMSDALVVLGNQSWQKPFPIDVELPAGKYKLAYTVDFQDKKALQIGNTEFVITEADVAERRKPTQKSVVAQEKPTPDAPHPAETKSATVTPNLPTPDRTENLTVGKKP